MPRRTIWQQRWKHTWGFLVEVWQRFCLDRIPLAAGSISYFLLLSVIPLLLFGVSVALFFISPAQVEQQLDALTKSLAISASSEVATTIQQTVLAVVENRGRLAGISLVVGLWAGSQIFVMLESAINLVWHSTVGRPYWKSRGLALVMVFIVGSLMLMTVALANLVPLLESLQGTILGIHVRDTGWLVRFVLNALLPLLLVTAIFTTIYRALPTKRVTLRSVLPGAIFAGVAWVVFLRLFGWYTGRIHGYSVLYGSLGGIVLLMVLFYYSAYVLLIGAEIAAVYHRRLVEAGDVEERMVEETAAAEEAQQEWEHFHSRLDTAEEAVAYYGYQHRE